MPEQNFPMLRLQRIAAAAMAALLLACPASAQLIGSGHVMGNGTSSSRTPTDTPLGQVLNQSGSGITKAGNTNTLATVSGVIPNGHCRSTDVNGNDVDAGGACTVGGGGGTVSAGVQGQIAAYAANGSTVVGIPTCVPIETFAGGVALPDNTTAFLAVTAAFGSGGGCIQFAAGNYTIDNSSTNPALQPTITYPANTTSSYSVTLRGLGSDLTNLLITGTNGIKFVEGAAGQPSFHIQDLSFITDQAGTQTAFAANFLASQLALPPQSDFTNVSFHGDNANALTHYFSTNISLTGVSYVNFVNVNIHGKPVGSPINGGSGLGISISGDVTHSSYGVIFNLNNVNLDYLATGILYGDFTQGVSLTRTNVNFNTSGIQTVSSPVGVLAGLIASDSNFNNYGNNIVTNAPVDGVLLSNNLFILFANSAGVICNQCNYSTIVGNHFSGFSTTNTNGISLAGTNSGPITVSANTFAGLQVANEIGSGVTNAVFQSNGYAGNTSNFGNAGSIKAGSCTGIGGTCAAGATP